CAVCRVIWQCRRIKSQIICGAIKSKRTIICEICGGYIRIRRGCPLILCRSPEARYVPGRSRCLIQRPVREGAGAQDEIVITIARYKPGQIRIRRQKYRSRVGIVRKAAERFTVLELQRTVVAEDTAVMQGQVPAGHV